jgi:hypothetical protein
MQGVLLGPLLLSRLDRYPVMARQALSPGVCATGATGRAAVMLAELDAMEALTAKLAGRMYQ